MTDNEVVPYQPHEGGEPDGHLLTELAALEPATLSEVVAFADAVGFAGASGLAVHWEGVGPIARQDHGRCPQQVEDIRAYHVNRAGYSDIAYNHLACIHDVIFDGRGWDRQGAATCNGTFNRQYWAICAMIGTGDVVTPGLKRAIRRHWDEAQRRGARSVICHRDACSTQCPGDELCAWVKAGLPADVTPKPPEPVPVLGSDPEDIMRFRYKQGNDPNAEWGCVYIDDGGNVWNAFYDASIKSVNFELLWGPQHADPARKEPAKQALGVTGQIEVKGDKTRQDCDWQLSGRKRVHAFRSGVKPFTVVVEG